MRPKADICGDADFALELKPAGCKTGSMNDSDEPTFDASERAILDRIDRRLHAQGRAKHATTVRLLWRWRSLSASMDRYSGWIDDYTNHLTRRDGLAVVLGECDEPLRAKLAILIEQADGEFLASTRDDTRSVLGRYFQIDESSGWWWKRIPAAGPLAEYLNSSEA